MVVVPAMVTPDPFNQLPYTFGVPVVVENVIALVRADMSSVPILYDPPWLTVPAAPVLSKTAVSCASGKLAAAGVPPLDVAQAVAPQL
jgi:hypothetical protein